MEKTKKIKFLSYFVFTVIFFTALPVAVQAANLYFSPSSGSHAVGATLSVNVYVSSADQTMNAASGIISFPQDKLEVTSLSKSASIFSLWVQEPSFFNSGGTINFEGIVLNPGFTGAVGKIITINFRVKTAGRASLTFSSGSTLANDGKGTNILTGLGDAAFYLGGAAPTTVPEATMPGAPAISSPTHPDPNKWYAQRNANFTWAVPSDVTAVRLLYDKNPGSRPSALYSPPISEKQIENLKDGTYHFHARFRNSAGWGATTHFRFKIDTQPPEPFSIKFIDGNETENPRPKAIFDTTDSLSGIGYYKIKISEGDFFHVAPEIVKSNPYTLPSQAPGKRSILVQAFDKAGNYTVATEDFTIKPLPAPIFAECPKKPQISFLSVAVPLVLLIIALLFILWHGWHKFSSFRKKLNNLRKEVREAESALHQAFDMLKEDIRDQVKLLEKTKTKRQLTEEEEKIIKQLRKDLDDAEKFVRKEIKDIEEEIR